MEDYDDDGDDIEVTELEAQFNRASRHIVSIASNLDSSILLDLYARFVNGNILDIHH